MSAAFGAHGLAQLVGFGGAETGDVDGHLHELFLEQRDAQGLLEAMFEQGVQIGHGLGALASPKVGVHGAALDRARADKGHFDHEVIKCAWAQAGERCHLGPALDLENPD